MQISKRRKAYTSEVAMRGVQDVKSATIGVKMQQPPTHINIDRRQVRQYDMKFPIKLFTVVIAFLLFGCKSGGDPADLKPVQQQKVGDYTVAILSETGTMKHGATTYTLEFRKTADNQLVDVGRVEVAPVMEMAGMGPMMGAADVTPTSTPGRYEVKGNLTMAGLWKLKVNFGADQSVRFSLNAE